MYGIWDCWFAAMVTAVLEVDMHAERPKRTSQRLRFSPGKVLLTVPLEAYTLVLWTIRLIAQQLWS